MSLPTPEELMNDYDKIVRERNEEHEENKIYIDEDYSPADLTPRYLRADEPSEILEDELKEKLKKFKDKKELKNILGNIEECIREYYTKGIFEIYDVRDKRF